MKKSAPAPKTLSKEAKTWWRKLVAEWQFDDHGLLILASALEAFDRMREAQEILKTDGQIVADRFGQKKAHPATLTERDSRAAMLAALKALRLDLEPLNDGPGRPTGD